MRFLYPMVASPSLEPFGGPHIRPWAIYAPFCPLNQTLMIYLMANFIKRFHGYQNPLGVKQEVREINVNSPRIRLNTTRKMKLPEG